MLWCRQGYIFIANPPFGKQVTLTIDGKAVDVAGAYNSRGLNHSRTFLGYYFDATEIAAGKEHSLELTLPTLPAGAFTGIFWNNIETEYS